MEYSERENYNSKIQLKICESYHNTDYSPTNEADDEEKDAFYDQLQKEIESTLKHDMLMIIGDAKEKVGCDNKNHERVLEEKA